MKPGLLMVDDDEAIRTQMKWALSQDYDMCFAEDRRGALEAFEASAPAVTLLDLGLPPRPNECDEGLAALSDILAIDSTAKVIVIAGQSAKRNAIPENLLESELFGHEKGAFTGAHVQRKGLLETAGGGTLFLDEIGELPPAIQVKLLRFLQEQRLQRVGGRQEIQVDTRLVAATNADLKELIDSGKFREDLYFRLAVVTIRLLPLRERGEDIVFLAREFLQRYAAQNGRRKLVFAPDALRAIARYSWPGNVRELQNRVKRGVIMTNGSRLTGKDLELGQEQDVASSATSLKQAREQVEREMIQQALKKNSGRITSAAADLGISRPTLYELMEKLGIAKERANTTIN